MAAQAAHGAALVAAQYLAGGKEPRRTGPAQRERACVPAVWQESKDELHTLQTIRAVRQSVRAC